MEVGRTLSVQYLVTGSVRRSARRIRIIVKLIDCVSGNQVWADSYDVEQAEVFEMQDQLVGKIAATLVGRVAAASVRHAKLKPPSSLAAYELVLRANAIKWDTLEAKAEARALLERAIEIDPEYAAPYSLLAAVKIREATYHTMLTPAVAREALRLARQAVDSAPSDSATHSVLSWVFIACRDNKMAETHVQMALELNPRNPFAMVNRGTVLVHRGLPDQALAWFEKAAETDPFFNPGWIQEKIAFSHFTARRYVQAADHLARVGKLRFYMHALAGAVFAQLGEYGLASSQIAQARSIRPDLCALHVAGLLQYEQPQEQAHLAESLALAGLF